MSNSPNLSMPFIMPAQAQKHVTHNEAIELIDALVQLRIAELDLAEPPADATEGQVFGIGAGATGPFEGRDGALACHYGGGWIFITPRDGFCAWIVSKQAMHVYREGTWRLLSDERSTGTVDGLGINTTWNQGNRLSVSAPETLLSHENAGHRLKINKAAEGETASVLFQNAFSGRAEIGLAGDDALSVKVSADGSGWSTALRIGAETGDIAAGRMTVAAISGDAVQSSPEDTSEGRLMRADWGYGPGNVVGAVSQSGGMPTGAVVERGENEFGTYTRWADGTQICARRLDLRSGDYLPGRHDLGSQAMPASFRDPPIASATSTVNSVSADLIGSTFSSCLGDVSSWQRVHLHVFPGTITQGNDQVLYISLMAFGCWY